MDRRSLIAIVLCALLVFAWYPLMQALGLMPERPVATAVDSLATAPADTARPPAPAPPASSAPGGSIVTTPPRADRPVLEQTHVIETDEWRAEFSSRGARLMAVTLKRYAVAMDSLGHALRRDHVVAPDHRVVLGGAPTFGVDLGSGADRVPLDDLVYEVEEVADSSGRVVGLTFTAGDSAGLAIRQSYRLRADGRAFDFTVERLQVPESLRVPDWSLTVRSWPALTESDVAADARVLRAVSLIGRNIQRQPAPDLLKKPRGLEAGDARWAAVQSRYFIAAIAVEDGVSRGVLPAAERYEGPSPRFGQGHPEAHHRAINSLVMALPARPDDAQRFLLYVGPGDEAQLAALGHELDRAVDLGWGWLRPISKLLLVVLRAIHVVVQNYGVAIVLLALLVRLLLHPLNMSSMKSMRAMVKLQPEMERLKEKYKNDPQAMNQAVLALYRENKVNPAGGCLPLIMQMPIFFALYNVLQYAIELRQAPFVAWINDLSAPDTLATVAGFPIRVLPVLMTATGLLQQWLTPTPPQQASTGYIMNVVMLVFFYGAPSGLVIYWTVMNLFSAVQQWLVIRHDGHGSSSAVVVEEPPRRGKSGRKSRPGRR